MILASGRWPKRAGAHFFVVLRASDSLAAAGRHKERGGFHSSLVKWGQQLILLYISWRAQFISTVAPESTAPFTFTVVVIHPRWWGQPSGTPLELFPA